MDAYWRAANYLSVGQIYLCDNPLLREPLKIEHVKRRLLGHWGTTPRAAGFSRLRRRCSQGGDGDVIDRVPQLGATAAHVKQAMR